MKKAGSGRMTKDKKMTKSKFFMNHKGKSMMMQNLKSQYGSEFELPCHCSQILLADDEPFNLIALESMLEGRNVKCEKVFNGQEVLDQLTLN